MQHTSPFKPPWLFLSRRSRKGSVHADDPHVPIAVTSNHNLVNRRHAIDAHTIVWPVAQGPADGMVLLRALQQADIPVVRPRQDLGRALAQALRHPLIDEVVHLQIVRGCACGCICCTCDCTIAKGATAVSVSAPSRVVLSLIQDCHVPEGF